MKIPTALGVCGSIAAWKACALLTHLRDHCDVTAVMTKNAEAFIGPQSFLALTGNPVITTIFESSFDKPKHIDLADRIKALIVAPATANFIAKFAQGIADDALTTLAISVLPSEIPVVIAPAMNTRMWMHPATQANVATLKGWGVHFIEPEEGDLACGWTGRGRLAEPETIAKQFLPLLKA